MANMFPYKSFCWSIGTTSYRTINFNKNIEWQLELISEFKNMPDNMNRIWQDMQIDYYNFLHEKEFLKGNALNPAKDAREKTSGLVDIGLLDNERNLTEAGHALLEMSKNNDFSSDNIFEIAKDSYLYLRQLLKTIINVDGVIVRPFIVFLYAEAELGYITYDEFTYLLPLCIDFETTKQIITLIKTRRNSKIPLDEILLNILMTKDNYKSAFDYFLKNQVIQQIICDVGMNRKSPQYDKAYFPFYNLMYDVAVNKNYDKILELFEAAKKISDKPSALWRKYLFKKSNAKTIKKDGFAALNDCSILHAKDEQEFKNIFFEQMHLFKMKSTLADYMDLNRRYFKITDVVIFADGKVELDILPKCYFNLFADELLNIAFERSENLYKNIPIEQIAPCFKVDEKVLYAALGKTIGVSVDSAEKAKKVVRDERYKRFDKLIDEKFTAPQIIDLLTKFENRNDKAISSHITDNADAPTMFEYVLGIAWYLISERQGDILEYMNLSLEADLLPKSHAVGGGADIEYLYDKTADYPAHCLLIEATLSDKTNQRRMEMEPVSRHLGNYIIKTDDKNAYCVFISTYVDINVTSDFRNRRTYQYFSGDKSVTGLKILPLQTSELKRVLEKGLTYAELYGLFEQAYQSDVGVREWYGTEIGKPLEYRGDCLWII